MTAVRELPHVGEWRVTFDAPSLEGVFVAIAGFIADACGDRGSDGGEWETAKVTARDLPALMVDWANELVGRSEAAGRAYAAVRDLRVIGTSLRAQVRGDPVEHWLLPIKAATYHGVVIEESPKGWHGTLLFDV